MIEVDRDGVRRLMVEAMSGWSEENYAAGWLTGLGERIRKMANGGHPEWMVLAYLAKGWPELPNTGVRPLPGQHLADRMVWEPLSIFEETTAREFIVRSVTRPPGKSATPQRNGN